MKNDTIDLLKKAAEMLDAQGEYKMADEVDGVIKSLAEAKSRTRPSPVFDSTHPKVKDNKDHFPLGDADQARNALARANQYSSAPDWWGGSLEELVNAVVRKVKKEFPSIDVSKSSSKPGKG